MKTKHFMMLLLLIACVFRLSATDTEAQTVDIKTDHLSIRQLFTEIEKQTDYLILLRNDDVDVNRIVHLKNKTGEPAAILDEAFRDTGIHYVFENKYIVLSKSNPSEQQQAQKKITGRIVDENGEAIIGANVAEKGANNRTITDMEGKFSINVSENSIIQISYIGYIPQEITVGNRQVINVQLKEDTQKLDEVVVVGYGVQKKVSLTGAVASVTGEQLAKRPISNTAAMLQGQIPGLSINQGTGQPGNEGVSLRIRGQGTYSGAGSDPLVLIDGVPGNLSALNANDIESVSVLKDASSASIYGSRSANGVIMVTTKTGEGKGMKLSYDLNLGVHTPTRLPKFVTNSAEYMRLFNEARTNSGNATTTNTYPDELISLYENATDRNKYPNYDWQDYAFNPAVVQNHNLSLSGGNKGTSYNISLGYIDQPGTMRGYEFDKYNFRSNLKSKLNNWTTIGSNLFLERGNIISPQAPSNPYQLYIIQAPTYGPHLPDGSGRYTYTAYPFESFNNSMVAITGEDAMKRTVENNASAQLWVEFEFFKNFKWYTKGAVNYYNATTKDWCPPPIPLYNYHTGEYVGSQIVSPMGLTVSDSKTFYTNLHSYFSYETAIAKDHNIRVQAGYSQETETYQSLSGYRKDYLANLQELNAGIANTNQSASGTTTEWAIMSLFGQINYDYKSRYLLDVKMRYDGTSRIYKDNRWGYFPSASAGWRITEEEFMENLKNSWLNNLKIRGSYGLLGNQNIGNYPYQAMLSYTGNYSFDHSTLSTGVAQTAFSNKEIKWESTSVFDIGMDVTLFKGLLITYDYYKKHTTDILRGAQVSALLGLSAPTVNSGAMINYGHELTVKYDSQISSGTFNGLSYGAAVNLNKYKNEAANFGTEEISNYYLRRNGVPYNSYYMLDQIGIFQTQEEIDSSPKQFSDAVKPGDIKFRDANGDGVVNDLDRVIIPGKFPKLEYSFNLYADWKGFDLSVFFQGITGTQMFVGPSPGISPFQYGTPPTIDWVTERWTGPGTSNHLPRITFFNDNNSQNRRNSTYFLQNSSYLRLKNLILGYSLPKEIISHIKLQKVRVYVSGDNLATWTPMRWLEPERPGDGNFAQYPQNKIISFGLNVEF